MMDNSNKNNHNNNKKEHNKRKINSQISLNITAVTNITRTMEKNGEDRKNAVRFEMQSHG